MADLTLLELFKAAVALFKGLKANRKEDAEARLRQYREVYEQFLGIHADYLRIFEWAKAVLSNAVVHPQDHPDAVTKLRGYFARERRDFEQQRIHLRSLVAGLLGDVDTEAERRFLWSLLSYFLDYEEPIKSLEKLDSEVSLILGTRDGSALSSASTTMLEQYDNSDDVQTLYPRTQRTIEGLAGRASNVGVAYAALRLDLSRQGAR